MNQGTPPEIRDREGTIAQLYRWADFLGPDPLSAAEFVYIAFGETSRKLRSCHAIGKMLTDGQLGLWEVLARATEWDASGITTLVEFVDALTCEVQGQQRNEVVRLAHQFDDEADQHDSEVFGAAA